MSFKARRNLWRLRPGSKSHSKRVCLSLASTSGLPFAPLPSLPSPPYPSSPSLFLFWTQPPVAQAVLNLLWSWIWRLFPDCHASTSQVLESQVWGAMTSNLEHHSRVRREAQLPKLFAFYFPCWDDLVFNLVQEGCNCVHTNTEVLAYCVSNLVASPNIYNRLRKKINY